MSAPSKISLVTRIKWRLFRLLERLSDLRGNNVAGQFDVGNPSQPTPAFWVFVSTIGELNAIDPLLRELHARLKHLKLVLITDRPHYRDSYLARYPQAEVCITLGHSNDATRLAERYPPRLLVVAEIPCWPGDAPCRFSFAFVLAAKHHGAAAAIVNGWLYHYAPPSRMDTIERQLFQTDYLQAFDAIGAQTEEVRRHLIKAGAPEHRIEVTGNIKFDAMQRDDWSPNQARSPVMLAALLESKRHIIVAGCVTNKEEQELVLDAFYALQASDTRALLVLAPRHPEVPEVMRSIHTGMEQRKLRAMRRTAIADFPISDTTDCLVLDTMGELRDFYAAATIAHVGVDHNVLEPLAFHKPVTVRPGWETTYPSFPIYRMLSKAGILIETGDANHLANIWLDLMSSPVRYSERIQLIGTVLSDKRGATSRHMAQIETWIRKS
jgi:3-deoxy-D-manno-octulosonic-acid transferase